MLTNARLVFQSHDHQRTLVAALDQATALCAERGVRLTSARRTVLELLWQSRSPLGAYQLQDQMSKLSGKSIAPPQFIVPLSFLLNRV